MLLENGKSPFLCMKLMFLLCTFAAIETYERSSKSEAANGIALFKPCSDVRLDMFNCARMIRNIVWTKFVAFNINGHSWHSWGSKEGGRWNSHLIIIQKVFEKTHSCGLISRFAGLIASECYIKTKVKNNGLDCS